MKLSKRVFVGLVLLAGLGVVLTMVWSAMVGPTEAQGETPSLSATFNQFDRSVDLTLSGGPDAWWFKINGGGCTSASGETVRNIRGYGSGTHYVKAYPGNGCGGQIAETTFTIDAPSLSATVNNDQFR